MRPVERLGRRTRARRPRPAAAYTAAEVRSTLAARDSVKGEITILIGKATEPEADDTPVPDAVEALVRDGLPRMDAIKQVARRRGLSKREVYAQLVRD